MVKIRGDPAVTKAANEIKTQKMLPGIQESPARIFLYGKKVVKTLNNQNCIKVNITLA